MCLLTPYQLFSLPLPPYLGKKHVPDSNSGGEWEGVEEYGDEPSAGVHGWSDAFGAEMERQGGKQLVDEATKLEQVLLNQRQTNLQQNGRYFRKFADVYYVTKL